MLFFRDHIIRFSQERIPIGWDNNPPTTMSYRELPDISKQSSLRRIFEDVLVRSVNDIDSTFSKEAFVKNFTSGAVGTVVVWVDGHLLVANVGDLEATLCSENLQSHEVVEGHVFKWKVSYWANGIISIARAIIRGFLESAGVVSEPDVTDSKPLTANDTRFVVAISSIFERLPPRKITFSETEKQELLSFFTPEVVTSGAKGSYGVRAIAIASTAQQEDIEDNLSAIVVLQ